MVVVPVHVHDVVLDFSLPGNTNGQRDIQHHEENSRRGSLFIGIIR